MEDDATKPTNRPKGMRVSFADFVISLLCAASTHVDRLLFRGVRRLVAELLQISCGLDRPPNGPDDDAEDVARCAESRSDPGGNLGRVEDDDWEGHHPYP